jgi:hypothetical protein
MAPGLVAFVFKQSHVKLSGTGLQLDAMVNFEEVTKLVVCLDSLIV